MTEVELQDLVIELAHLFGWRVAHFRPARTVDGWRTAVAADGADWPDLTLVRDRIVFAELKSSRGKLHFQQRVWRDALTGAGAEHYLWSPADWDSGKVECVLR
ncbi:MAG TPA: hypothetical protein VN886_17875 [Acidimicrobiales bacterium]|nr:hypothetical protein [Acidimicrobiales bacterium]